MTGDSSASVEKPLYWGLDPAYRESAILDFEWDRNPDLMVLLRPDPVQQPVTLYLSSRLRRRSLERWDVLAAIGARHVLSPRAADVVAAAAGTDIELLDCDITVADGTLVGWKAVHHLVEVECFDRVHSKFVAGRIVPELILSAKSLAYLPGCLGEHAIALLRSPRSLIVSPAFARAIDAAGLRGFRFLPDSEVRIP
jgi:hypothetical protein